MTINVTTYTELRKNLANVMDAVNDDHKPILVTRQKGKGVVIMSVEDFKAYEETFYLMASPKNAERLNLAIAEIEAGQAKTRGLIEE